MKKPAFALSLLLFIFILRPAFGQSYDGVEALFNAGDFEQTITQGRAMGTSAGLTLALRGQLVLIQYVYEPEDRMAAIEQAINDGQKAVALDPDNVEAKINLGIAVGLRGKPNKSVFDGKESRRLFEEALAMSPENSWALGTLASWHAETVHQAGFLAARFVMGARKKNAWALFEEAMEHEPGNLTIRAAYVRALMKLNPKKHDDLIRAHMDYILAAPADNALERLMKEQIRQIDHALAGGDKDELELLLEEAVPLEMANGAHDQG